MTKKPKVFIGSARESISYVDAIHQSLSYIAEVTPWHTAFTQPNTYNMEHLERELNQADFAVFVFSPDDIVKIRDEVLFISRDNTLFEMGLFWGKLRRNRVFFLMPEQLPDHSDYNQVTGIRIPTDLSGLAPLHYEVRRDNNLLAAVSSSCAIIKKEIEYLGKFPNLEEIVGQLQRKESNNAIVTKFLFHFTKYVLHNPSDKFNALYENLRTAYSTPEGFTVSGGAIWVAGEEELTQVAGNEGKGKSFPFNVNNKVDQNDKKIKVVESYLNSEDLVVLKDDYIVKTYLLCYPIGNQLVATIHMSGARELSTEELDLLFVNNHELLRVANYLFRGDV